MEYSSSLYSATYISYDLYLLALSRLCFCLGCWDLTLTDRELVLKNESIILITLLKLRCVVNWLVNSV